MTDLVHYAATDSWVPMLGAVGDLATKVAATEFVGKGFRGKPASVAAAILTGRELNLGPMTSLRGLDVIDGRVSMSAQLMAAKIQSAGHRIDWIENTDKAAEVRIVRGDGLGEGTARWTMGDAQRAGLAGKTNWAKYPRAMLKARALTECAGMVCADVLMGVEAGDSTADDTAVRQPAGTTVVQVQTPARQIDSSTDVQPEPRTPDPTVAVPAPPESAPVVEPPADMISGPQRRKIGALIGQLEKHDGHRMDRQERRDFIAALLQVEQLESANDLTKAQAGDVIDRLEALLKDTATDIAADIPGHEIVDAEVVE